MGSTRGPTVPVEVRNAQPFHTSINGNSSQNENHMPTFSKLIGRKLSDNSRSDIYLHCWVNFTCDAVVTKIPNFMNLGLSDIHTLDEFGSFSIPANRIVWPNNGSNWIHPGHLVSEVIAAIMSRTRSEQNHISKTDF